MLNRDRFNNADQQQSAVAAMTVIDRLQNFPAEQQLVGLAATFLFVCEHFGIPAQDAFTVTKNVINDTDSKLIPEFRAVREYVRNEL
jgi:hypothetical protein